MPSEPILAIQNIHKHFGDGFGVLHGVSLDLYEHEIACILGPSGCGKTTLLRVIAGLESPDRGDVIYDRQSMLSVPVHKRSFGLMFQDFALFPHRNVAQNVAFGLRMQGLPRPEIDRRVKAALELVNLSTLANRDVNQLSGGEQQRVALARSLAPQPRLLMLDEPMGALDRTLRDRLLADLRHILKQVGVTVLYVTHDQSEAFAIADRIILMSQGQMIQVGTPQQVYRHPHNAWAARFMGMENLLPGQWAGPGLVDTEIGQLRVAGCGTGPLVVLIRPEAAAWGADQTGASLRGIVLETSFRGATLQVTVQCTHDIALSFHLPSSEQIPPPGHPISLTLSPEGIVCLPR